MKLLFVCLAALYLSLAVEGANYVRWGRTTCPDGATPLMTGYTAGSVFDQVGFGANYVCLSDTPLLKNNVPGDQKWTSYLMGASYVFNQQGGAYGDNKPFSFANSNGVDPSGRTAACVLCYRTDRAEAITIYGRNKCPNEAMALEYTGFVMSEDGDTSKTEYICVDDAPEIVPGAPTSNYPSRLFPAQVSTLGLPSPPYQQGNEVTCCVCTI